MARPRRPFLSHLALLAVAVLVLKSLPSAHVPPPLRIIAAANVTLRQGPSAQATAVGQLPLGTEVSEVGDADADKTWVHVVSSDGKEGWVLANLTRPLDPFWKWQTEEQVITDRLARKGDGFAASVELVNFIERVADSFTDPQGRARMDLHRLKALQQALLAIPFRGGEREPYASWLSRYKSWTIYNEPGGAWLVANDAIWKVHDARGNTAAADDIAWFSVTVGLGGECEGYIPCYLEWRNRLQGEYLRRYPVGAHGGEAVAAIGRTVALVSAPPAPNSAYSFDPKQDCAPFATSVDALTKAVTAAKGAPDREKTLAALAALRGRCR